MKIGYGKRRRAASIELGPARDSKTRLADALEEWIRTTLEASDRKRTTKDTYTILLRTHALTDPIASLQIGHHRR